MPYGHNNRQHQKMNIYFILISLVQFFVKCNIIQKIIKESCNMLMILVIGFLVCSGCNLVCMIVTIVYIVNKNKL